MTFPDFDRFQQELIADVIKMRDTKGKEYANSANRFDNFNRSAAKNGVTRLQVANIFLQKHMDSIDHFIKTGDSKNMVESLRSRFVDSITYLTLIAGMIEEDERGKDDIIESR